MVIICQRLHRVQLQLLYTTSKSQCSFNFSQTQKNEKWEERKKIRTKSALKFIGTMTMTILTIFSVCKKKLNVYAYLRLRQSSESDSKNKNIFSLLSTKQKKITEFYFFLIITFIVSFLFGMESHNTHNHVIYVYTHSWFDLSY